MCVSCSDIVACDCDVRDCDMDVEAIEEEIEKHSGEVGKCAIGGEIEKHSDEVKLGSESDACEMVRVHGSSTKSTA